MCDAFYPVDARPDVGALWENFLVTERLMYLCYTRKMVQTYFWRSKQRQEVDYVELIAGKITGFEFKWNPKSNIKFPKTFTKTYNAETRGIHRENFRSFIMGEHG